MPNFQARYWKSVGFQSESTPGCFDADQRRPSGLTPRGWVLERSHSNALIRSLMVWVCQLGCDAIPFQKSRPLNKPSHQQPAKVQSMSDRQVK